jgi:hypothetical protein
MKVCVANYHNLLDGIEDDFDVVPEAYYPEADKLIIWNDILPQHRAMITAMKEMNKPTFVIQHGKQAWTDYKNHKPLADYFLAWGDDDKKGAIDLGWSEENVFRVGCPYISVFPERDISDKIVTFAPEHHYSDPDDVRLNHKIWNKLLKVPDIKPTLKIINNEFILYKREGKIVNTLSYSNSHIKTTLELLSKTLCLIQNDVPIYGTINLLAKMMNIPIVKVNADNLDNLNKEIKEAIFEEVNYSDEVKRDAGYIMSDNPRQEIVGILKRVN